MLITPVCLGSVSLDREQLKQDKKTALKVGPCGIGLKAVYLNSFYIDRRYYVPFTNISRVFKRVAMSRGGFTGKGVFGSMSYLVVEMKDGTTKQCNFKYEQDVDLFLEQIQKSHPEIPVHSLQAEKKLKEAEEAERAKYLKELSKDAQKSIGTLERAKDVLEAKPILSKQLTFASKQKRVIDNVNPTYRIVAVVILLAGILAAVFGGVSMTRHMGSGVYFLLFGFAGIFVVMASRVLPTGRNNKAAAQKDWDQAVKEMDDYLSRIDFPVPPQYAHPIVLDRMIREIRQGRAVSVEDAFALLKEDLKGLNNTVKVSQKEYDEVVAIKPMFLVCDYN